MAHLERWAFVILVLGVGLAIWLVSVAVSKAEFSLIADTGVFATEVRDNSVTDAIVVPGLEVLGVRRVESLDGQFEPIAFPAGEDVRIDGSGRPVTIPALRLASGMRLSIDSNREPGRFTLSLTGAEVRVRVLIPPQGKLMLSHDRSIVNTGVAPRPVELVSDVSGLELSASFGQRETIDLLSAVAVANVRLWRVEPRAGTPGVRISGIRSGSLTFLETPDRPIELHKGDDMELELVEGSLQSLSLSPQGVELNLSGRAADVRKRIGFSWTSTMPTWFDRLAGMTSVRVATALITFLAGLEVHRLIRRKT